MPEVDITLSKEKYRNPNRKLHHRGWDPPDGTWTYVAGSHKSPSNHSGEKKKSKQGLGHRRRAYNTHFTR